MRTAWSERQVATVAALATVVLCIIGFLLPGSPPKFDAPGLKMVLFFQDNHKAVLIGTVLVEIGVALFLFVIAEIALAMGAIGQRTLAAVIGISGATTAGLLAAGAGLYGGLAQLATSSDRATLAGVRPLYELDQFIQTAFFWTALVIVVSLAVAGLRGVLPSWTTPVNAIIGVLFVLGGISVKASGAFAAGTGALVMIASLAFFVMIVEFGVLLWRPAAATVPAGAPIIA